MLRDRPAIKIRKPSSQVNQKCRPNREKISASDLHQEGVVRLKVV